MSNSKGDFYVLHIMNLILLFIFLFTGAPSLAGESTVDGNLSNHILKFDADFTWETHLTGGKFRFEIGVVTGGDQIESLKESEVAFFTKFPPKAPASFPPFVEPEENEEAQPSIKISGDMIEAALQRKGHSEGKHYLFISLHRRLPHETWFWRLGAYVIPLSAIAELAGPSSRPADISDVEAKPLFYWLCDGNVRCWLTMEDKNPRYELIPVWAARVPVVGMYNTSSYNYERTPEAKSDEEYDQHLRRKMRYLGF